MTKLTIVEGTWGGDWAKPGSLFRQLLAAANIVVDEPPFVWSMNAAGFPRIFDHGKDSDWRAGGYGINLNMQHKPFDERIILAHSYGGNCVAHGLASPYAVPIKMLVTVGTPNRHDMDPVWEEAVKKIGYWVHFHDPKAPLIERWAQVFDGKWDWPWNAKTGQKHAHHNVPIKGMGHTKVLDDPNFTKGDGMLIGILKSQGRVQTRV